MIKSTIPIFTHNLGLDITREKEGFQFPYISTKKRKRNRTVSASVSQGSVCVKVSLHIYTVCKSIKFT